MADNEAKQIRVLLVDDHEVTRCGVATFLQTFEDIEIVGGASDGEEAIRLCEILKPDVILMDLKMPGINGMHAMQSIRAQFPHIRIVPMSSLDERMHIRAALDAGASGYILKSASRDEVGAVIRAAYAGVTSLSKGANKVLGESQDESSKMVLTARETEVLCLMARGMSNREIANELTISVSTVKFHIRNIFDKLKVLSRTEAVAVAIKNGIIDNQPPPMS